MSRLKGSSSSKEAKDFSHELEILGDKPFKYNFDYLRMIELLISYRIAEAVCDFDDDTPIEDKVVTVEIPLIGDLTIYPRLFHAQHRLTGEPSAHFDFKFDPSSCFKSDIVKAYTSKSTDLTDVFSNVYGDRLKELYSRLCGGD
jgi:hypothetical protein